MMHLDPAQQILIRRGAEHLHRLGARAIAEFVVDIGEANGCASYIIRQLAIYSRLTPETLRVAGADRFPPAPPLVVPQDLHSPPPIDFRPNISTCWRRSRRAIGDGK